MHQRRAVGRWLVSIGVAAAGVTGSHLGCKRGSQAPVVPPRPAEPMASRPAVPGDTPVSRPLASTPAPATAPPSRPASTPATATVATLPACRYDSSPPYPVELYVRSPDDEQPGWLRIVALSHADTPASCRGVFPEKNRIYVDTNNVRELRLHIGHLPLAERKSIILQIDGQGIELVRKRREFVVLGRRPTGEWTVIRSEP